MTQTETPVPMGKGDGGKQVALITYILYFVGFFVGITMIAAIVVAYLKKAESDLWVQSHYQFIIRTFWIGLLAGLVGLVLAFVGIGFVILLALTIWSLIRLIKGVLRLSEGKPIDNPTTLLW